MNTRAVQSGEVALGIELGSTRIKACLIDVATHEVIATGSSEWHNRLENGLWTYSLDEVWAGIASAYADLATAVFDTHSIALSRVAAVGVSAMMHGYLAFDDSGAILAPFRTWRNTNTGEAAAHLTERLGQNIPLRWSVAHFYQAMCDREEHVPEVAFMTTLAGYVHWRLTGERVLGVGDAAGMFPLDSLSADFDSAKLAAFDTLAGHQPWGTLRALLPRVLRAGEVAGRLTPTGAKLLDPSGVLRSGALCAPPEGDAGTGMVATGAIAPRSANVSVGTSVFAMVVLEREMKSIHHAIDVVATPEGVPVAMVHCNNGASELGAWGSVLEQFLRATGVACTRDEVFSVMFAAARMGAPDAGGVLAYNQLSGEPIVELNEGRPLVLRAPDADFSFANLMRAQLYGVFATLRIGLEALTCEGVEIDQVFAHGGVFKTAGVAQQFLADALATRVTVADTASEGGAWGMAILAAYVLDSNEDLGKYLEQRVFRDVARADRDPDPVAVAGYQTYLDRYLAGLAAERAAVAALPVFRSN